MTQQAEPVNSNTRRLDGYVQSERALNGATDQTEARVSDTNRTIGTALESIPLHIPEQNPSQHSPNKRPRFDTWAHSAASPVSDGDGPLYNFVSLPVNSPSLENLTMPPPPISTTSPRTANGPGNIPSGYTANQAPTPRRQSSSNNLGTGPPQPGPATPALTPTTSPHPAHQAINTRRTPSMSLLPRLQAARADPSLSQAFSEEWGSRRLLLLEEACRSADWLYLTLHQIFCWRTIDGDGLVQLGFVGRKELELINLEVLLMPNTHLSFMACNFFATFPTTHEDLLHGSSPDAKDALALIHKLLENMSMHWPLLQESCRTRGFPPSPYELYETLGMRSTVLQEVFFTFLFRQIEGGNQWVGRAQQFFKFTQKQLIDRLTRGSHGRSEAFPNMDVAVAQFAKEYFNLRRQCALSPGFTGNASNVQSTTQPPTTSASSPVVQPSPHLPATAILSRQQNQIVPPGRVSQPTASRMVSGSHVEAARNISKRTASQPVAANNAQSEIGLRQQTFMQETLGVQVPGQTTVQNQGWRPSGFQQSPVLVGPRNAQSSSSGIVAPGPIITNRPTTSLNGASVTIQNSHLTLERTPLLPPPGRLMTQNTHPNPDLLALHQARLSTPEPSIPKVEENSPVLPRLFLVFERFALTPQLITKQQSYYSWQINIPEVDKFRTALDVPVRTQPGRPVPLKREYRRGSFIYRLRCIKLTARLQDTDEAAWAVAPTFWPVSCFVSLNAEEIEIRRKSHWGRNLPCDLTRNIKAGPNLIEMSVHFSPEEMTDTYAIAVELVEVLDHSQCTLKCNFVEKPDSLAAVIASLTTAVNDDDVASVDPYISIYLIDPFTAQIWKIPVRGKTCTHRECFDLEAFLQSRPKKHTGFQLSSADSWKCPICDKDARPHCLVLDGFLLSVSKQLRVGSDEEEEVRNIRVTADGFWKPVKAEKKETRRETSVKEDLANPTSARSTPSLNASKETVLRDAQQASRIVIDLDSD